MRKLLLLALIAALAAPAVAQENKEPEGEKVAKMFELKYASMDRVYSMLGNLVGRSNLNYNSELRMLVVKADRGLMPAVEEIVRKMDVPTPAANNIELTIYLLQASQQQGTESRIPDDLQSTVKQLRSIFAYQSFRVLDVMMLRSRVGEQAEASGILMFDRGFRQRYQVSVRTSLTTDEKGRLIRLDRLQMGTRVPQPLPPNAPPDREPQSEPASISANLDIREGQRVVVGKTGIEGSDKAMVLVVSGKVVE